MYTPRSVLSRLKKSLKTSPVVLLTGARQTGKTTLVRELAQDGKYTYVTFDDLRFLSAARSDPIGFLAGLSKPVILDEIQRVPDLFLAIKHDVDQNRLPGRYLLTGSANPLLIPKVADSLAGRMEILRLYPFSQGELMHMQEHFIDSVFKSSFKPLPAPEIPIEVLCEMLVTGGYPIMQTLKEEETLESWCNSYITSLLQKDVRDLARIEGLRHLPNLLNLLSTRASCLLNVHELSRSSGIAATTLQRYLQLLQTLFLIDFILPWSVNDGKRFVKSPKVYLSDTGLLCFLLGVNQKKLLSTPSLRGNILENFVVSELLKQMTWNRNRTKLYFMRSTKGEEVDVVLENKERKIVGIEIKGKQQIEYEDFKGLRALKTASKDNFIRGIIVYPGEDCIPFGKDMFALPLSSIWKF